MKWFKLLRRVMCIGHEDDGNRLTCMWDSVKETTTTTTQTPMFELIRRQGLQSESYVDPAEH